MPSHHSHSTRPFSDSPRDISIIPDGNRGIGSGFQTHGSFKVVYAIPGGVNSSYVVSGVVDATEGEHGEGLLEIYPFSEQGPNELHRAVIDLQISVLNRGILSSDPTIKLYSASPGTTVPVLGFTLGATNVSTDSMTVLHDTSWGNRRSITWSNSNFTVTAVMDTRYLPDIASPVGSISILDHNIVVRGDQVDSLQVKTDSGLVELRGNTALVYGHNSEFAHSTSYPSDSIFDSTSVTFNVIPGAGLGQYKSDCDDPSEYIRTINGFSPDENGDIIFGMSDCLWNFHSFSGSDPALAIHADCDACVDCLDFDGLYNRLRHIYLRAVHLHARIQDCINLYEYYLSLIGELKDGLDDIDMTLSVDKTADDTFIFSVRLKTGSRLISKVEFSVSWSAPTLELVDVLPYSRRRKLPGLAPVVVPDNDPAWGFSNPIGPLTVDEDISAVVPILRPNVYAMWSWFASFVPEEENYPMFVVVNMTATATEVNENGTVIGTHTFTGTLDFEVSDPEVSAN